MNRPMQSREQTPPSRIPSEGWHCSHFFYLFDRAGLETLPEGMIEEGAAEVTALLDPSASDAPTRMQTSIVSGHKADFALMLMDPDPLKVESIHQRLMATQLGSC